MATAALVVGSPPCSLLSLKSDPKSCTTVDDSVTRSENESDLQGRDRSVMRIKSIKSKRGRSSPH
jgi:hypothetical protein